MILLTGATGFLGSNLLEELIKRNYKVLILKRTTSNTFRINKLLNKVISYDIDIQPLEIAFEQHKIDCIIHTACNYGKNENAFQDVIETNLNFGIKLLTAALKFNVSTFINTDTLLKKNINLYSLSKKQFVEWLKIKSIDIKVINLKIEYIYGPNDDDKKFISWVVKELTNKSPEIGFTKGEQLRDFIYITDVVEAFMIILNNSSKLESFNEFDIATGEYVSVRYFLEKLKNIYENYFGSVVTKFQFGKLAYRKGEQMQIKTRNQKLIKLGWIPKISIEEGITKLINNLA
jgi:CDP-paratose synthetase